jgi:hypothetical protein
MSDKAQVIKIWVCFIGVLIFNYIAIVISS